MSPLSVRASEGRLLHFGSFPRGKREKGAPLTSLDTESTTVGFTVSGTVATLSRDGLVGPSCRTLLYARTVRFGAHKRADYRCRRAGRQKVRSPPPVPVLYGLFRLFVSSVPVPPGCASYFSPLNRLPFPSGANYRAGPVVSTPGADVPLGTHYSSFGAPVGPRPCKQSLRAYASGFPFVRTPRPLDLFWTPRCTSAPLQSSSLPPRGASDIQGHSRGLKHGKRRGESGPPHALGMRPGRSKTEVSTEMRVNDELGPTRDLATLTVVRGPSVPPGHRPSLTERTVFYRLS